MNDVSCGFVIFSLYYVEVGSLFAHFPESFQSLMGIEFCEKGFLYPLIAYDLISSVQSLSRVQLFATP